jgi:putative ABC transport system permease protein
MTADRESILVSKALAEKLACVEGDMLYIIEGQGALIQSKVVGIIDYWPTINPKEVPEFVIAPYSNVFKNKTIKPYEVWLKLAPSATADDAIRELKEKDIPLLYSNNVADMIALDSRSAMRMGTNGILTLGFMVTVAAFAIGFLLYWVLSIKGRTLQFGILRSMGLSKMRLSWMLVYEQIMITGAPIFASIFFFVYGVDHLASVGCGGLGYPVAIRVCLVGFSVYSLCILREKLSKIEIIGLTAVTLGIIGMSLK